MTLNDFKVVFAQWWAAIIWPSLESLLIGAGLAVGAALVEYIRSGQPITAGALFFVLAGALANYGTSKLREIAAKHQQQQQQQKAQEVSTDAQLH